MPQGLQTVSFFKTAITGGAFEALAPATGDSATFFNVPQGSVAYLAEVWAVDNLHACEISLTASRFHDQLVGINVSITPGDGNYGSSVALNATDNRLHANTDYALLGFTCPLAIAALAVQGVDTGNLRVGGPVLGIPEHDAMLFYDYANSYEAPLIPIINSNNAGSTTLIAGGPDQAATSVDVMLAELKTPFSG